jgi:hypothetical protein
LSIGRQEWNADNHRDPSNRLKVTVDCANA